MMTARQMLLEGGLEAAIARGSDAVKAKPSDPHLRITLFELLSVAGDLDRAEKQLDVLSQQSAEMDASVARYRNALRGEKKRRKVFEGAGMPSLPREVPPFTYLHLDALSRIHKGDMTGAEEKLTEAFELSPNISGSVNGTPVQGLTDADNAIGPFLEIITPDDYCWLPLSDIRSVLVRPPKYLRDLIWTPAFIELHHGPLGEVYLPSLYSGSHLNPDPGVRLGESTVWTDETIPRPSGQKMLSAGDDDFPLLEIREITLEPLEQADDSA